MHGRIGMNEFYIVYPELDEYPEENVNYPMSYYGVEWLLSELSSTRDIATSDYWSRIVITNRAEIDRIVDWAGKHIGGEFRWIERKIASLMSA